MKPNHEPSRGKDDVSRREFIQTLGVTAAAGSLADAQDTRPDDPGETEVLGPGPVSVTLARGNAEAGVAIRIEADVPDTARLAAALGGGHAVGLACAGGAARQEGGDWRLIRQTGSRSSGRRNGGRPACPR